MAPKMIIAQNVYCKQHHKTMETDRVISEIDPKNSLTMRLACTISFNVVLSLNALFLNILNYLGLAIANVVKESFRANSENILNYGC